MSGCSGSGSKIALFLVLPRLPGRLFQYSAGCPAAIIILPLYTGIYILSSVPLPVLLVDLFFFFFFFFFTKFQPAERVFNICILFHDVPMSSSDLFLQKY